jgi:phospholipid-binding lipoprotein MlaA
MRFKRNPTGLRAGLLAACFVPLAGCTVAPPRTDDPWEKFNRKMYAFNDAADRAVIRPTGVAYRKVTSPDVRRIISNFFANLRMPITIVNDVLQAEPQDALRNTGRFVVNSTIGFAGLFDPASELRMPLQETDFGVTLARWGLPEGPYLVLPLIGSTSVRDIWRMPADRALDPLGHYAEHRKLKLRVEQLPSMFYLVTLRARGLDAENLLDGVYDPYVFYRDAYRQRRLYDIYDGQPPAEATEILQGTDDIDVDALLEEQREYERQRPEPSKH